jgi:hypothetical protein
MSETGKEYTPQETGALLSVADLIALLWDAPQGVGVFFAAGNDVAAEDRSGLAAPRDAIASVQVCSFHAHGKERPGYVLLVGKQYPARSSEGEGR